MHMKFKSLLIAMLVGVFGFALVGCSGETGTDEVKSETNQMKVDKSQEIPLDQRPVEENKVMGPPKRGMPSGN